jgi:hypothetical protein
MRRCAQRVETHNTRNKCFEFEDHGCNDCGCCCCCIFGSCTKTTCNVFCCLVPQGSLRTGSVFEGITDYVTAHSEDMEWLTLENVAALAYPPVDKQTKEPTGPSNLDCAVYQLENVNLMFSHTWLLWPMMFGVPAGRLRLYNSSMRQKKLAYRPECARLSMFKSRVF